MAWIQLNNGQLHDELTPDLVVKSDIHPNELGEMAKNTASIAIEFTTMRDGRGFSLAHLLRKKFGFNGKILADGHIIPDQAQFLLRSGFDYAQMGQKNPETWRECANRFSVFYQ